MPYSAGYVAAIGVSPHLDGNGPQHGGGVDAACEEGVNEGAAERRVEALICEGCAFEDDTGNIPTSRSGANEVLWTNQIRTQFRGHLAAMR
jgi:hypothetical protein